ncbi:AzlD domain-containing protein [Dehalobacter sp. DCM]|uniref:branched-chain amino acid transporter permease n=1 Tax=Dehalobacter sp. DCM TaxID=2907827 RepID=UPI0030812F8B|nr:AzlD domain-containing protein [Dehalobacter sp. DCM]
MILSVERSIIIIVICALCTILTRSLPFLIFGNRPVPKTVQYLGMILPMAVMATLVVYCIRDITFTSLNGFLPTIISLAVTVLLHFWRKNTFLSIITGTACYMFLIQVVFSL